MSDSRQTKTIIKGSFADMPLAEDARLGDEYHVTEGTSAIGFIGDVFEASPDAVDPTELSWKRITSGSGTPSIQSGTGTLVGGQATIASARIVASSRILVTRRAPPGGGTAIGILGVTSQVNGNPGSFLVQALAEANQALVAADVSTFDWVVVNVQ